MKKYGETGRKPTKRQMDVVHTIERLWDQWGMAPTLRELGQELGIGSTNGVADLVKSLERRGMVYRGLPGTARSLMTTRMEVMVEVRDWPWDRQVDEDDAG